MSVLETMEDVIKTVTTTMGATPAHVILDMLAVASMDVWVCSLVHVMSMHMWLLSEKNRRHFHFLPYNGNYTSW